MSLHRKCWLLKLGVVLCFLSLFQLFIKIELMTFCLSPFLPLQNEFFKNWSLLTFPTSLWYQCPQSSDSPFSWCPRPDLWARDLCSHTRPSAEKGLTNTGCPRVKCTFFLPFEQGPPQFRHHSFAQGPCKVCIWPWSCPMNLISFQITVLEYLDLKISPFLSLSTVLSLHPIVKIVAWVFPWIPIFCLYYSHFFLNHIPNHLISLIKGCITFPLNQNPLHNFLRSSIVWLHLALELLSLFLFRKSMV